MLNKKKISIIFVCVCCISFISQTCLSEPVLQVDPSNRCSVCGMFVAKYPAWVAEIIHENGDVEFFDGVKDMMAYYFHPDQYGGGGKTDNAEIWVKDYYSLSFIDARKAFFVTGSDVFGPMGHEFIPFSSQEASEAFLKDHKAKSILTFTEITEQMVDSMREGRKMK